MHADRFTIRAQEAVAAAARLSGERRNPQVTPEHLLAGLLEDPDGIVVSVLRKLGADPAPVARRIDAGLAALPVLTSDAASSGPSSELTAVIRGAESQARALADDYVSTEHLLLALSAQPGPAGEALRAAGASSERLLAALAEVRGPHRVSDQ
jgi:ATP-dependent Clp protease ATP-binding subunit ClpB